MLHIVIVVVVEVLGLSCYVNSAAKSPKELKHFLGCSLSKVAHCPSFVNFSTWYVTRANTYQAEKKTNKKTSVPLLSTQVLSIGLQE